MAMQVQYPSNACSLDYRSCYKTQADSLLEAIQMMQSRQNPMGHLLPSFGKAMMVGDPGQQEAGLPNSSVFSEHPLSELTCNASGSKKRPYCNELLTLDALPVATFPQFLQVPGTAMPVASIPATSRSGGAISSAFPLSREQSPRVFNSAATSTSGRHSIITEQSIPSLASLPQELLAQIFQQNFETDVLIRLQNERLRLAMEEARNRHCNSLLSIIEQRVVKRIREKEIELENANRKNAELEQKITQMCAENQIWFNLAKNNEAIASNLRINLEQVLENTAASATASLKEGYGDSDGTPITGEQSCCYEDKNVYTTPSTVAPYADSVDNQRRMACKLCGGEDVCVLVLPCRHLCLCKDCEANASVCPICNYPKKACLRIFTC